MKVFLGKGGFRLLSFWGTTTWAVLYQWKLLQAGFQGQETDPEFLGGAVSYKYRVHDVRIGEFFSVDPLAESYPWSSPYAFAANAPIVFIDREGLGPDPAIFRATVNALKGYLQGGFLNALELSNNTSVRKFEMFSLSGTGEFHKFKGAYGEALAAYYVASGITPDERGLLGVTLTMQNKSINGENSTPDFTLEFTTHELEGRNKKDIWEHDVEIGFRNIDGEYYREEFDSEAEVFYDFNRHMLQYEVKALCPSNSVSYLYTKLMQGIDQINQRLNAEGIFTQD